VKLAVLVVNYDSGAHAVACVRSLLREAQTLGLAAPQVVVVDCASSSDQTLAWQHLRSLGAEVVCSPQNLGYAGGMQLAATRAAHADTYLILNPDLVFAPGSLQQLLDTLTVHPTAVIAPRCSIDEEGSLYLPPVQLPTPSSVVWDAYAAVDVATARQRSLAQRPERAAAWSASHTYRAGMLSGACLLVRQETMKRLGVFLDASFPLYYEDADLCKRAAGKGVPLYMEPRARVAHRWSRSAGHGERFAGEPLRRLRVSRRLYLQRHHGWIGACADGLAAALESRAIDIAIHECHDLGVCHEPPDLSHTLDKPVLWELSVTGGFGLCGGRVLGPHDPVFSPEAWSWLPQGRYWSRFSTLAEGRVFQACTWHKADHSVEPLLPTSPA